MLMPRFRRLLFALLALLLLAVVLLSPPSAPPAGAAGPEGQIVWGVHITLAPTWFDPAEASGLITPFLVYYALHDALVKPMPGQPLAPNPAASPPVSSERIA